MDFSETIATSDLNGTSNWVYEGMWVLKFKVISLQYFFQVLYVLCFTRPRYQVSVYRTIGPLVSSFFRLFPFSLFSALLAHLSRRLIGELIVYQWSGVRRRRPSSVVVRRPSTMLKHLLLQNRLADQSQILCGASLGRGNEILFAASGSHDQDGRHAHIW